jgi:hypothetical protein
MKPVLGYVVLALLLFGGGTALWSVAGRQERLAEAERDLAALRFDRATAALDGLSRSPGLAALVPGLDPAGRAARLGAAGRYWQSNYDEVANESTEALLAANAAYRAVEREGGVWATVVARLDTVVRRYAEVLRSDPGNEDAAYNYEFVVRRRAAITAAKQKVAPVEHTQAGRTLHGDVGGPPEGSDMKQFKMMVPMQPQERKEAEEAGRGQTRIRKG